MQPTPVKFIMGSASLHLGNFEMTIFSLVGLFSVSFPQVPPPTTHFQLTLAAIVPFPTNPASRYTDMFLIISPIYLTDYFLNWQLHPPAVYLSLWLCHPCLSSLPSLPPSHPRRLFHSSSPNPAILPILSVVPKLISLMIPPLCYGSQRIALAWLFLWKAHHTLHLGAYMRLKITTKECTQTTNWIGDRSTSQKIMRSGEAVLQEWLRRTGSRNNDIVPLGSTEEKKIGGQNLSG